MPVAPDLKEAMKRVSAVVHSRRRELGLSQQALAAKAKLRQETISELENGHKAPSFSTLFRLAEALDLDLQLVPRS